MTHSITPHTYKWRRALGRRIYKPPYISLHHSASSVSTTVDEIHKWHLDAGYSGFGYHAAIYPSGKIVRGRPIWAIGAHTFGHNECLGIVFIGNWENLRSMPKAQLESGQWLIARWRKLYSIPKIRVKPHKSFSGNSTACPGRHFPFSKLVN